MARQSRAFAPGVPQLVMHRSASGAHLSLADDDLDVLLALISAQTLARRIPVHAYSLNADRLMLVTAASTAASLSGAMQSIARHFADHLQDRHDMSRPVFDGRFRSAVIEPGAAVLETMRFVEQQGLPESVADPGSSSSPTQARTSAGHHLGLERRVWLVDPIEYWNLGNTPFDRQQAWRTLIAAPLAVDQAMRIESALRGGWWIGSGAPPESATRPLLPGVRGRPKKDVPK
ncbi:hypothetical protein BH10PSE17_BH10PSE17_16410 [soil metagenome]